MLADSSNCPVFSIRITPEVSDDFREGTGQKSTFDFWLIFVCVCVCVCVGVHVHAPVKHVKCKRQ